MIASWKREILLRLNLPLENNFNENYNIFGACYLIEILYMIKSFNIYILFLARKYDINVNYSYKIQFFFII